MINNHCRTAVQPSTYSNNSNSNFNNITYRVVDMSLVVCQIIVVVAVITQWSSITRAAIP